MSTVAKTMSSAFKALGKIKTGSWKEMKKAYKEAKGINFGELMTFMQNLGLLDPILKPLGVVMKILAGTIKGNLAPIVSEFLAIVSSPEVLALITMIADAISFMFALIYAAIPGTLALIQFLWDFIVLAFTSIWNTVVGVFDIAGKSVGAILAWIGTGFKEFGNFLKDVWEKIVMPVWNGLLTVLEIFGFAIEVVVKTFWGIIEGFVGFFQWVGGVLGGVFGAIIWGFKQFINFFIQIINGFLWLVNLIPGINISAIPLLETGGGILKSGLAIVDKDEHMLTKEETAAMKSGKMVGREPARSRWEGYDIIQGQQKQIYLAEQNLKYTKRMYRLQR